MSPPSYSDRITRTLLLQFDEVSVAIQDRQALKALILEDTMVRGGHPRSASGVPHPAPPSLARHHQRSAPTSKGEAGLGHAQTTFSRGTTTPSLSSGKSQVLGATLPCWSECPHTGLGFS